MKAFRGSIPYNGIEYPCHSNPEVPTQYGLSHQMAVVDAEVDGLIALLSFPDLDTARKAVKELSGGEFDGKKLTVSLLSKRRTRDGRLLIRNLPWSVTESELQALFCQFGAIVEVHIPEKPCEKPKQAQTGASAPIVKKRGFGFVEFELREDAERALAALNGKTIHGRTVLVEFTQTKEQLKQSKDAAPVFTDAPSDERTGPAASGPLCLALKEDASSTTWDDEKECTLYVRNVPFQASEAELTLRFEEYGPLRYLKIVKDRETGESRGSAFVCYQRRDVAEHVLALANPVSLTALPKRPTLTQSVLTPDAGVAFRGRILHIMKAVEREEAHVLEERNRAKLKEADKRHLYLSKEGGMCIHLF